MSNKWQGWGEFVTEIAVLCSAAGVDYDGHEVYVTDCFLRHVSPQETVEGLTGGEDTER